MNIADNNRARLQNNVSATNWAFDFSIHDDPFSLDAAAYACFGGDDQRGAVQVALDLPVDFDQTLSGYAADNLEPFGYNCSFTPK